jgi:uncharacterized damage-inducible protein DinB
MANDTAREFYVERLKAESAVTLQILKALPKGRLDYKPDQRSPSAHQLAWTLAYELKSCIDILKDGKTDWKPLPPQPMERILQDFEQNANHLAEQAARTDEENWERPGQFLYDGQFVSEHPVGIFLWLSLFDSIHHRGQLAAYLRPMGGKVPAIYGPSADDPQGMGAWH